MRYHFLLFTLFIAGSIFAQEEAIVIDTTIYEVVEEAPRFPACEQLDTTILAKQQCAEQQLLSFMYQNINYPYEARRAGVEGSVVLKFVVELNGTLTHGEILKDIGGGCGLEALRVAGQMNTTGIRWVPGKIDGKVVRSSYILPLRFKLQDPPDFEVVEGDSIWLIFDKSLTFAGGDGALQMYLSEQLSYPETGNDSCLIGTIDMKILVRKNGEVRIENLIDYNDLGFDFWYEAVSASTSTMGQWSVAEFEGKKVGATFDLSMNFTPEAAHCKTIIQDYDKAATLINEATPMLEGGDAEKEKALKMMGEALGMFPNDGAMLIARGQAFLELKRLDEACADLTKARGIALVNWFDAILPLICK